MTARFGRTSLLLVCAAALAGCSGGLFGGRDLPEPPPVPASTQAQPDYDVTALQRELIELRARLLEIERQNRMAEAGAERPPLQLVIGERPAEDNIREAAQNAQADGTAFADAGADSSPSVDASPSPSPQMTQPMPAVSSAQASPPVRRAASLREAPSISTGSVMPAVHLASYRRVEMAEAGWRQLASKHAAVLGSVGPRGEVIDLGERGIFYRLKGGPFPSRDAADNACTAIRDGGDFCRVTTFDGAPLRSAAAQSN